MKKTKALSILLFFCLLLPSLTRADKTYTNSRQVRVCLTAFDNGSGVTQMRFSFDNSHWLPPEDFAETKQLELPEGDDGIRCVFVEFGDKIGNWSEPIAGCIELDTTPPSGTIRIEVIIEITVKGAD